MEQQERLRKNSIPFSCPATWLRDRTGDTGTERLLDLPPRRRRRRVSASVGRGHPGSPRKVTQLYIYILYIFLYIFSVVVYHILNLVPYSLHPPTPNSQSVPPPGPPLYCAFPATIASLFFMSMNLFLFLDRFYCAIF